MAPPLFTVGWEAFLLLPQAYTRTETENCENKFEFLTAAFFCGMTMVGKPSGGLRAGAVSNTGSEVPQIDGRLMYEAAACDFMGRRNPLVFSGSLGLTKHPYFGLLDPDISGAVGAPRIPVL
jgi:hypothetical protein